MNEKIKIVVKKALSAIFGASGILYLIWGMYTARLELVLVAVFLLGVTIFINYVIDRKEKLK